MYARYYLKVIINYSVNLVFLSLTTFIMKGFMLSGQLHKVLGMRVSLSSVHGLDILWFLLRHFEVIEKCLKSRS
jgi:hypothetical protein